MKHRDTVTLSSIMTPKEVAEYLQIHTATLYILIRRGEIPSFKIGTDHRFRRDEIEKWIAEKQRPVYRWKE